MTPQHPITPPNSLINEWARPGLKCSEGLIKAARWGADQELEACLCEVSFLNSQALADRVREARRPKPLSLKRQALQALGRFSASAHTTADEMTADFELLRQVVGQLDD